MGAIYHQVGMMTWLLLQVFQSAAEKNSNNILRRRHRVLNFRRGLGKLLELVAAYFLFDPFLCWLDNKKNFVGTSKRTIGQ